MSAGPMGQEEFDARMDAGEDPYGIVGDDLRRRGYVYEDGRWKHPDEWRLEEAARRIEAAWRGHLGEADRGDDEGAHVGIPRYHRLVARGLGDALRIVREVREGAVRGRD